jgi:polyether ionophore transport system permease protein
VAATAVIATFVLDTLGAALDLPDAVLELSIYKHLGQPMAGSYDVVGIVVAAVLAVGGLLIGAWGLQRRDVGR